MKKNRLIGLLTCFALALSLFPATALAVEESPGCTCETACAENAMNADCPVCGAEGAAPEDCGRYAAWEAQDPGEELEDSAQQGQDQAGTLPTADDLQGMADVQSVEYLDEDGKEQTANNVAVVDNQTAKWSSGWYVVNDSVTIGSEKQPQRVTVTGEVHLILADNASLTVHGGINVAEGNALTIYAQSTDKADMGSLTATVGDLEANDGNAGIGGGNNQNCGTITINGGNIVAECSSKTVYDDAFEYYYTTATGAGIGGGQNGGGGTITINGGYVKVTGAAGAGIGGGQYGAGGTIRITGGVVDVTMLNSGTSLGWGAGIGGGSYKTSDTDSSITIIGGLVNAEGRHGDRGDYGAIGYVATNILGNIQAIVPTITGGMVFDNGIGEVYGDFTLTESYTIPTNSQNAFGVKDLVIPEGSKLIIPKGVTLTVPEGSTLTVSGAVEGEGEIDGSGKIEGTGTITGVTNELAKESAVSVSVESSSAEYGSSVTITATISEAAANTLTRAAQNQVEFFVGTGSSKASLGTAKVETNTAALAISLSGETWDKGFQIGANTITAEYGGSAALKGTEDSTTLTVSKKPVIAEVIGETTKPYDGTTGAYVKLGFEDGALVMDDDVTVTAPNAAYEKAEAGDNIPITLGELAIAGKDSGWYTVTTPENVTGSITPNESDLDVVVKNGGQIISEFIYGDTVTVEVNPKPRSSNTLSVDENTAALFYDGTLLASTSTTNENGAYVLTYDTAGKNIPIGESVVLTIQFGGNDNLNGSQTTTTIKLNPKPVTAVVDGEITKTYDRKTDVTVKFKVTEDLEGGDSLTGEGTGNFEDANAGKSKNVTVERWDVIWGENAERYNIALPSSITGSITAASVTKPFIDSTGGTKPGDTLKAVYIPGSGEKVDYQWNREGQPIPGATSKTYIVQVDDVGKKITVTVSSQAGDANHTGTSTSEPVAAGKGTQTAPGKPEQENTTTSSITVKEIAANTTGAGVEYSIDGGKTWQTERTFTGLSSGTKYTVIARYQETDAYNASPASEGAEIYTDSSGGGGSSAPTYRPDVVEPKNGDVTITPRNPEKGDKVTIKTKPDEGYEVGAVTVTDKSGKDIKVTERKDGTYTFTQPSGKVKIEVTFQPIPEPERPWNNPFADVDTGAWYYEAVQYVQENGLMNGTSGNTFSPDVATSRGMIVTILWRLADSPAVDYAMNFSDVDSNAYYGEAVRWAASEGITGGYGNGAFGPNDAISREQLAVMLYRFAQEQGYDVTARADLNGYADAGQISGFAREAMSWASAEGLINGTSSSALSPQGRATRAQVAAVLMRFGESIIK